MISGTVRFVCVVVLMVLGTAVTAQPTTQPSFAGGTRGARGRGDMLFQRLRESIDDLKLSEEQKTKIDDIFTKAQQDVRELGPTLQNLDRQQRQQKIGELMSDLRQKLADVLNDEQKQQLQEKLQTLRRGGRLSAPPAPGAAGTDAAAQPRFQQMIQRLEDSLKTLDLSDEQKSQVNNIVDDGKKQLGALREKVQAGAMKPDEMRPEAQKILSDMRDQLAGILSQDQQQKLRDAIQSRYEQQNARPAPATEPVMMKDSTDERPRMENSKPSASGDAEKPQDLAPNAGPQIGQPAPQLALQGLTGRTIQLSSYRSKPLVIEFGSYTSPSFRQRAPKMEELARQYGLRAYFLIVYTKEAHAQGEWEIDRNRDEGVRVEKHADIAARRSAAKDARQALRITLPIALDSMEDAAAKAFGAGENSAVVIGRDGSIVAKQMWCDPYRLRTALDEALSNKPTTQPQ